MPLLLQLEVLIEFEELIQCLLRLLLHLRRDDGKGCLSVLSLQSSLLQEVLRRRAD